MQSRALRIVLRVVGLLLLVIGGFITAADLLDSFHSAGSSNAASFTIMVRTHWAVVALVGVVLFVLSFFVGRRRV